MVDAAVEVVSSLKVGEDAFTRVGEALDSADNRHFGTDSGISAGRSFTSSDPGLGNLANHESTNSCTLESVMPTPPNPTNTSEQSVAVQIPLELISSCVATLLVIQVMSIKAIGIAIKLTLEGVNQVSYFQTWIFAMISLSCIITQLNYLNKDYSGQSVSSIASTICGFITELSGTAVLHSTRDPDPAPSASLVYMVYPGAVHSLFEHSIGVYFLAGEAVEKLQKYHGLKFGVEPIDLQTVKLARLLHDIGHGPFSHLYEREFLPRVLNGCTCESSCNFYDLRVLMVIPSVSGFP